MGEKNIVSLLGVGWRMLDIRKRGQRPRFPVLHLFRLLVCLTGNPWPLPEVTSEFIGSTSAGACREEPQLWL